MKDSYVKNPSFAINYEKGYHNIIVSAVHPEWLCTDEVLFRYKY